ncbi:unnamed protein product [Cyprideis torosa]|uniref:WD repeat-containing protein 79 n=1 Tax=Cyprideis torosa TaxID=163714 RepID=A0A7R8WFX6_9CRUS|nr:unnamed protein product [Cyprideis torosa]CAG0897540.1 unnamed protein product [Cyprideis torosa]
MTEVESADQSHEEEESHDEVYFVESPDGTCFLTATNDSYVHIFNAPVQLLEAKVPEEGLITVSTPAVQVLEGDCVYDYCWYPSMNSQDRESCCFLSTSRGHPIHLYDAYDGSLRASFRSYDHVDEVTCAYSLAMASLPASSRIASGLKSELRIFDVNRPGRGDDVWNLKEKRSEGQSGVISCLSFYPHSETVIAAGCYDATVGLYDELSRSRIALLRSHKSGVTQVMFHPLDSHFLFSGTRRTVGRTNFLGFVFVRGTDHVLRMWDLDRLTDDDEEVDQKGVESLPASHSLQLHEDCVNGVSFHPSLPLLLTASGQRHWLMDHPLCSEDSLEPQGTPPGQQASIEKWENSIKLTWCSC